MNYTHDLHDDVAIETAVQKQPHNEPPASGSVRKTQSIVVATVRSPWSSRTETPPAGQRGRARNPGMNVAVRVVSGIERKTEASSTARIVAVAKVVCVRGGTTAWNTT